MCSDVRARACPRDSRFAETKMGPKSNPNVKKRMRKHKCALASATMAPKKSKKSADSINQKLQMVMKSGA